jgi:hypothetical protein
MTGAVESGERVCTPVEELVVIGQEIGVAIPPDSTVGIFTPMSLSVISPLDAL